MCFEDDAAHAPLLRKNRSVEAVKRPDLPAGARSIWIEMLVDVNRADERRVGQSQIDRTAHRIDSPVVRAGGGLTLSRTPASCARTSTAGTLARVNPRESQDRKRHQRRTAQRSSFPCEVLHHILPCSLATVTLLAIGSPPVSDSERASAPANCSYRRRKQHPPTDKRAHAAN